MREDALPMISDVCNLSGPDLAVRLEQLRADLLPHLLGYEATGSTEVFRFPAAKLIELEEVVAFEQGCCEELHWSVEPGTGETVQLAVRGLSLGQSLMETLDGSHS